MLCSNNSTIASISVLFWLVSERVFWSLTLTSAIVSVLCALAVTSISLRLVAPSSRICCTCPRLLISSCAAWSCCCISCSCFFEFANSIWTWGGMSDFSSTWAIGFMDAKRSAITSAPGKSIFLNTRSPAILNSCSLPVSSGIMASTACWRLVWNPGPVSITTSYSPTVTSFSTSPTALFSLIVVMSGCPSDPMIRITRFVS